MELKLVRDTFTDTYTLGVLYVDGKKFCETLEDTDRHLESGGTKIDGATCIARGIYEITLSFSPHFRKVLPELHDVPQFSGIRIHGGNTDADTLGCILLGAIRTATGIAQCAAVLARLISLLELAEDEGEETYLTIE